MKDKPNQPYVDAKVMKSNNNKAHNSVAQVGWHEMIFNYFALFTK